MEIHHAMIVRASPERVREALSRAEQLSVWMAAAAVIEPPGPAAEGSTIEFRYGPKTLAFLVSKTDEAGEIRWQVTQPIWIPAPANGAQVITWTISPYEQSTLVDFRMDGWTEQDEAYPSVSYKWGSFLMRLKITLGDLREIEDLRWVMEKQAREK